MELIVKLIARKGTGLTHTSMWDVNGRRLDLLNRFGKSPKEIEVLVRDIETYLFNLSDIDPTSWRYAKFRKQSHFYPLVQKYGNRSAWRAIHTIAGVLFPEQTRTYLLMIGRCLISQGYVASSRNLCLIAFGYDYIEGEAWVHEAFLPILLEVSHILSEEVAIPDEVINDYKISYGGTRGSVSTYRIWFINGTEMHLHRDLVLRPKEFATLISEVEDVLKNKTIRPDLVKKQYGFWAFECIAAKLFPKQLKEYLTYMARQYSIRMEIISIRDLIQTVFDKNTGEIEWVDEFKTVVNSVVDEEYNYQRKNFVAMNRTVRLKDDKWKLWTINGTSLNFVGFDFTQIKKGSLRNEVKHFLYQEIQERDDYRNVYTYLPYIARALNFITDKYPNVYYCADINEIHIRALLLHLETEAKVVYKDKKLSVTSIKDVIRSCSKLIYFLIDDLGHLTKSPVPLHNYFDSVTLHNMENLGKRTEVIPEKVVQRMLNHLNDGLHIFWQRILLIMLNCGLRFKEVANLEENCLFQHKGTQKYYLKYIPWKVLESRRVRGLDDYHIVGIPESIAQEITDQKATTRELRLVSGLEQIFIIDNCYKITIPRSTSFVNAVNKWIARNSIVDSGNSLWEFESKQCRKTLAVDMITNGADLRAVSDMLGHAQLGTSQKFYAEVRKMKLADLNAEFYRKKFGLLLNENQLKEYSEEDRQQLYVDFCLGLREIELGKCMKKYSDGPCSKRTGHQNCANCTKLCTGPQKLPKWKALLKSQKDITEKLRSGYERENIIGFENFREYQTEIHLLNLYQDTVDRIEAKAEEYA